MATLLEIVRCHSLFAHEGLMNSIDHRENILNPEYTHVGVGVDFKEGAPYFTINFYTPRK